MVNKSSFEEEVLALNTNHDLVFGKYNDHPRTTSPNALEPSNPRLSVPHKMKIISKMNEIINAKPVGELPTQHDWDDQQSVEMETITLMRKLGLEQSVDRAPDEKRTIATVPTNDDVIFMKNGRKKMSIFMADAYFQLKPRSEPSFDLDDDHAVPEDSTTSDFSNDVNLYQPIFETSQESSGSTSLCGDPEEKYRSRDLDCGTSSESVSKYKSIESQHKSANHQHVVDSRRSFRRDSSKRFSDSGSSSSSNKSWRSLNSSFSDERDENNWRLNVSKGKKQPEKNKSHTNKQQKMILNQTVTLSKESSKQPDEAVSSCGSALYKPKDLFMKKKAMMIQQVLAEYQS